MLTNQNNHTGRDNPALGAAISRRRLVGAAFAIPALAALLVACGSEEKLANPADTAATVPSTETPTTEPSTTAAPTGGFQHATGADDVVFRLGYEGGFVPVGYSFVNQPTILISGNGRVITPGAQTAIYPGALVAPMFQRPISEAGIQKVLELADAANLLQTPPDYDVPLTIADAPDTVVVLTVDGVTYRHQAYALGIDTETTDARKALAEFVEQVSDIATVAGAENLGDEQPLVAASYRIQARPLTAADIAGYDPAPTLVAWPTEAGTALVDAADCALVGAADVGTLFGEATQSTFFTENDITYQVAVAPLLPGESC